MVVDGEGAVAYWNAGAEQMFGYAADEALANNAAHLLGTRTLLSQAALKQLLSRGHWRGELTCAAKGGRVLQTDWSCRAQLDQDGRLAAVDCSITDVSEQRRAEKEIVLLHKVMEQRILKRTAELEESNEDLRDFAHSLAHDLRAPLASIDGFSAQLERRLAETLDDKCLHYLHRVRAGVKQMADLTDGLLGLADAANTELQHRRVDLSSVARQVMDGLAEANPDREIVGVVHETPAVQGDVRLLTDVLQNLIGNAWKFTAHTRNARVEFGGYTGPNGDFHYRVQDNGPGFDPNYAYKLFGPFQRLHTQAEFEGTGIGLAVVRKIITRHGGRVWAESQPGESASFYFTLNAGEMRR